MAGKSMTFTEQSLEAIANRYSWNPDRAPLCLGHPPDNSPSYGEVTDLVVDNGKLFANAIISPALLEAVRKGRYKKVSPSFNIPFIEPGSLVRVADLRHVGFLGAAPPAVKGMAALRFAEGYPPTVLNFSGCEEAFSEPERHTLLDGRALATRIDNYQKLIPSLTYWQAFRLATIR